MVPSEREIDDRLKAWGLVREDDSPLAPATSKNRTLICRRGARRRVLVKIADGPANVGVLREGGVLELLERELPARAPLALPRLFAFDRRLGLLAVEWIADTETLHHYHRRTGRYPEAIARQIGRGIGWLHESTAHTPKAFTLRDAFREESDLLECFLRMRPDFYARLSRAGIEFFASVQHKARALKSLQLLSDVQAEARGAALLHGDLRQANLLKAGRKLVFLDWELSFWGDPARDVGSIVADYALGWLAPERENEVLTRPALAAYLSALLGAYAAERGKGFCLDDAFQERTVLWTATALLFYVYGMTHYEGEFSARARAVSEVALDMLARAERWPAQLWGSRPAARAAGAGG